MSIGGQVGRSRGTECGLFFGETSLISAVWAGTSTRALRVKNRRQGATEPISAAADWLMAGLHPSRLPRAIPSEVCPSAMMAPLHRRLWRGPRSTDRYAASPFPARLPPDLATPHRSIPVAVVPIVLLHPPPRSPPQPPRLSHLTHALSSFSPVLPLSPSSPRSPWPLSAALPSGRRSRGRAA